MNLKRLGMAVVVLGATATVFAQTVQQSNHDIVPAWEISGSYEAMRANTAAGQCGCFWMNGGGGGVTANLNRAVGLVADLSAAHASGINGTTEGLTVFNYQFGPRYSLRTHSRFTPYGQFLLGGSRVSSNYAFYGSGSNFFASTLGAGVQFKASRHFALTLLEADWVFSNAVNTGNYRQNNLKLATGAVYRFGERKR